MMIRNLILASSVLFVICCSGNTDVVAIIPTPDANITDSGIFYLGDAITSNGDAMIDAMISDK